MSRADADVLCSFLQRRCARFLSDESHGSPHRRAFRIVRPFHGGGEKVPMLRQLFERLREPLFQRLDAHGLTNLRLPALDALFHRLPQSFRPNRLPEERGNLVLQGTGQVREGIMGRHDHDLSAQTSAAQPLQAQHPVPAGKADVQQHDVRRAFPGKTLEFRNVSGLVDLERWEKTVEQQDQRVALQFLVLNDERPQRLDRWKFKRRHSGLQAHGRFTGLSGSRSSMRVPPRGILLTSMEADFS